MNYHKTTGDIILILNNLLLPMLRLPEMAFNSISPSVSKMMPTYMRKTVRMKGQISVFMMPLNLKMGHVENWSQKLVLDVPEVTREAVPSPRAGKDTAAPIGPLAATAATAAELAAAATNAAPENETKIYKL